MNGKRSTQEEKQRNKPSKPSEEFREVTMVNIETILFSKYIIVIDNGREAGIKC